LVQGAAIKYGYARVSTDGQRKLIAKLAKYMIMSFIIYLWRGRMTPEQEKKLEERKLVARLLAGIRDELAGKANRLQEIRDEWAGEDFVALAEDALGVRTSEDESQQIAAFRSQWIEYKQIRRRIDELNDNEELVLQEAGILPRQQD
jgi:hypothetical protein